MDNVCSIAPEGGLKPDETSGELGLFLEEGEDSAAGLTLIIEFEDGQVSICYTLKYEKVMIEVLDPVDETTGATPIQFTAYRQMGHYWIKNATGGAVKDVTISTNGTEEYTATAEIPAYGLMARITLFNVFSLYGFIFSLSFRG